MKKVFVLMLAVLLLGTVGMAKVEIFESITIEIGATFAGATIADLGTVTTADINAGTWQGTIDGAWTATGQTCTDLGSISTVDINGGTINGITDLAVADGGTGSSNASDARTALGLIIGTDVQAYDDELTDIAGLTFADDYFILGTGAGTIGTASCTVFAQSILDDADAGTVLGTLGAVIGTNVQAWDTDLDTWATLTPTADAQTLVESTNFASMAQDLSLEVGVDTQAYDADLDTFALLTPTADAQTLLESTNFLSMTQDLSVEIGVDTQAYDADLDTFALLTPTADAQTLLESTNFASMTQDLSVEVGVDVQAYHANLAALSIADNQPITKYVVFDIEEATMDADDGTGIKVASVDVNVTGLILQAFVNVTQGYNEATDTIELVINSTDDIATPVTTLVAATDTSAAHLLAYQPTTGATVLGATTTTNRYVVVGFKDVGDDGSAGANLQGTLIVVYLEQ